MRDAGELEWLALGEGVADLNGALIVQADDVAGIGVLDVLALARHEGDGGGDLDLAAEAHVVELAALGVGAGADAQKGDTVAVRGVHVRLDLEHETAETLLLW